MKGRPPEREIQYRSPAYRELLGRLARNVRRLRGRHKWTQMEAAERCTMALQMYQRIESGAANVTLTTVGRLCEGFEVDVRKLFLPARARGQGGRGTEPQTED